MDICPNCLRDDGTIFWNEFNRALQCHHCGYVIETYVIKKKPKTIIERLGHFFFGKTQTWIFYTAKDVAAFMWGLDFEQYRIWKNGVPVYYSSSPSDVIELLKKLQSM